MSLERDILDAEPMKELSRKHPLLCSEMNGQMVLLKVSSSSDWWEMQRDRWELRVLLLNTFSEVRKLTGVMLGFSVCLPEWVLALSFPRFPRWSLLLMECAHSCSLGKLTAFC